MTALEATDKWEDVRLDFERYRKKKRLTPEMLTTVIGKSPLYVHQLLNGSAKGNASHKNLSNLFEITEVTFGFKKEKYEFGVSNLLQRLLGKATHHNI